MESHKLLEYYRLDIYNSIATQKSNTVSNLKVARLSLHSRVYSNSYQLIYYLSMPLLITQLEANEYQKVRKKIADLS